MEQKKWFLKVKGNILFSFNDENRVKQIKEDIIKTGEIKESDIEIYSKNFILG